MRTQPDAMTPLLAESKSEQTSASPPNYWQEYGKQNPTTDALIRKTDSNVPQFLLWTVVAVASARIYQANIQDQYTKPITALFIIALVSSGLQYFAHAKKDEIAFDNRTEKKLLEQGAITEENIRAFKTQTRALTKVGGLADAADAFVKYISVPLTIVLFSHSKDYAWYGFTVAAAGTLASMAGSYWRKQQGEQEHRIITGNDYEAKAITRAQWGALGAGVTVLVAGLGVAAAYAEKASKEVESGQGNDPHKAPMVAGFIIAFSSAAIGALFARFHGTDARAAAIESKAAGIHTNSFLLGSRNYEVRVDMTKMLLSSAVSIAISAALVGLSYDNSPALAQAPAAIAVAGCAAIFSAANRAYQAIENQVTARVQSRVAMRTVA